MSINCFPLQTQYVAFISPVLYTPYVHTVVHIVFYILCNFFFLCMFKTFDKITFHLPDLCTTNTIQVVYSVHLKMFHNLADW